MKCYLDPHFGEDADGNRATPTWFYEIEPSDTEYILDQLKDIMTEFDPVVEAIPETVEMQFINHVTEDDISIDIITDPFLEPLRVFKIITDENYQHVVESLIEFQRPLALKLSLYLIEMLSKPK